MKRSRHLLPILVAALAATTLASCSSNSGITTPKVSKPVSYIFTLPTLKVYAITQQHGSMASAWRKYLCGSPPEPVPKVSSSSVAETEYTVVINARELSEVQVAARRCSFSSVQSDYEAAIRGMEDALVAVAGDDDYHYAHDHDCTNDHDRQLHIKRRRPSTHCPRTAQLVVAMQRQHALSGSRWTRRFRRQMRMTI